MNIKSRTQINLPKDVSFIIDTLKSAGFDAYAVGGCVRDCILGKTPNDYDITTSALPLQIKKLFRRTVDTGIKHGTVTVLLKDNSYEVTTYRIDGEYEDSRHPKEVKFTDNLTEDLKRRDFTCNAMAYNDERGIVDEFDGILDMEKGIIRAVGDPYERFSEDALRILRAIRFSAQLNYKIDEKTREGVVKLAPNLSNISAERIQTELIKTLVSDHPDYLREAYYTGITKIILPELDKMMETDQNTPHHCYTVGEHTLHALLNVVEEKNNFTEKEYKWICLSVLFHDMGKPEALIKDEITGVDHFGGHGDISEAICVKIMKRLRFDNDTINNVRILVKYHDLRPKHEMPNIRKAIHKIGKDRMKMLFAVKKADIKAQSMYRRDEKMNDIKVFEDGYYKAIEDNDALELKDLNITGRELMEIGVEKGPKIGKILDILLKWVFDDPSRNNTETLTKRAISLNSQIS